MIDHPHTDRFIIEGFRREFARHKDYCDRAAEQIAWAHLRQPLSAETNSIVVIMKHVAGNLLSRFTDFFTSDGEKPWRDRDREFIDDFSDREAMIALWEQGWGCLFGVLDGLRDGDLARTVTIRGEPHTVSLAISRSLAHVSYHAGQIVLIARLIAEREKTSWRTLTVPRGESEAYNRRMGFMPGGG